jgi:NAD(P)H-flavin reductase
VIEQVTQETGDIRTFRVAFKQEAVRDGFAYAPGQFAEVSIFGSGEAPFCLTSTPTRPGFLEFSIKQMGMVTSALHGMEPGETIGVRGPLGHGFPVEAWRGQDLLFIGGGIGLAPLRSAINYCFDRRDDYGKITIVYGARTAADLVYKEELASWAQQPNADLRLTVDVGDATWDGHVGFVPPYVAELAPSPAGTVAVTCGPPIMIKFTLGELSVLGFTPEQIVTTLEMKMKCGIGKCGRCNMGSAYICADGPVFTLAQLNALGAEI